MRRPIPQRQMTRLVTLLLVGIALAGLAPAVPSRAQGTPLIQYLDNSQADFAEGTFERSAIGPDLNAAIANDQAGVVQLAPAGVLNPWDVALPGLPEPISNSGLVTLGDNLYVVAGERNTGKSDKVYRAKINRVTGRPITDSTTGLAWKEFTLKAEEAVAIGDCAARTPAERTAAARTRLGAASLEAPSAGRLGFVYVVGGVVDTGCSTDLSTPLVQIGVVNASGDITSWIKAPFVPTATTTGLDTATPRGLADPMVTIVRTSTNQRFIYVIGGSSFNPLASLPGARNRIYNSVVYAKINPADGTLVNPTDGSTTQPWAATSPIQFAVTGKTGLRDGVASYARTTKLNTNSNPPVVVTNDAILVAGGCYTAVGCTDNHDHVLKASITNPSTGALAWDTSPTTTNQPLGIEGRSGLGGLFYNGKFYIVGGTTSGDNTGASFTVPTAFFDSDINALSLTGNDFFVGQTDKVLPEQRVDTAVAVMPALPPANATNASNAAWVFIAGGQSTETGPTARKDSLYIGRVGGEDEATNAVRTRDGWYYSSIEEVTIGGKLARVLSFRWSALIDRSANTQADIRVEFRKAITASGQCSEDSFTSDSSDSWRLLDGDPNSTFYSLSNTGQVPDNKVELAKAFPGVAFAATCLQFRAQFLQNGTNTNVASPAPSGTPKLLSISIEKVEAGLPDLKVEELQASRTTKGAIRDVTISIRNRAEGGVEETIAVDKAVKDAKGSFFVHLCLAKGPLNQPFPTLTLPAPQKDVTKPACAVAYYNITNNVMTVDKLLDLPQTDWRDPNPPYGRIDLRDLLAEPGRYRLGVIIDHPNVIPEGATGELNNRGERANFPNGLTFDIEITAPREIQVYLPTVNR